MVGYYRFTFYFSKIFTLFLHFILCLSFQSIVSKLKSRATEAQEFVLDFTGIEQLTDFVFYSFLTNPEESLKKVTAVDLTGCLHITDQGLIWLASAFTGLKKVKNLISTVLKVDA